MIIKRSSKLMSPNSATNSVVSVFKRLTLSPATTLYYMYIIPGDPGAVSRRRKLSRTGKRAGLGCYSYGTSSTTHSNAGLRLGTKSNHWQAFEWVAELFLFSLRTADVSPRSCDAEGRFTSRNSVDQSALLTRFRTDFASSVWNFCCWVADFLPRSGKTSLSGNERGETSAVRRLGSFISPPFFLDPCHRGMGNVQYRGNSITFPRKTGNQWYLRSRYAVIRACILNEDSKSIWSRGPGIVLVYTWSAISLSYLLHFDFSFVIWSAVGCKRRRRSPSRFLCFPFFVVFCFQHLPGVDGLTCCCLTWRSSLNEAFHLVSLSTTRLLFGDSYVVST